MLIGVFVALVADLALGHCIPGIGTPHLLLDCLAPRRLPEELGVEAVPQPRAPSPAKVIETNQNPREQ